MEKQPHRKLISQLGLAAGILLVCVGVFSLVTAAKAERRTIAIGQEWIDRAEPIKDQYRERTGKEMQTNMDWFPESLPMFGKASKAHNIVVGTTLLGLGLLIGVPSALHLRRTKRTRNGGQNPAGV